MRKSRIPYEKYARFPDLMCKIAHCAALTLSLHLRTLINRHWLKPIYSRSFSLTERKCESYECGVGP